MATYPNTIPQLPIQSGIPSGWSDGSGSNWRVEANSDTSYTDRAIDGDGGYNLRWNAVGSAGDQEILVLIKPTGNYASGGTLYGPFIRNASDFSSGYCFTFHFVGNSSGGDSVAIRRATGVQLGSTLTFSWSSGTCYWIRFGASGTTLRAKIWQVGQAEPGSWQITTTDTLHASGYLGFGGGGPGSVKLNKALFFSAGTDGATAPGSGATLQTSALLVGSSGLLATAGIKSIVGIGAQLDLTGLLQGRFIAAPVAISAVLAATAKLISREQFFTKWQTPALLGLTSTLSAKATIPAVTVPITFTGDRYVRRFGSDYVEALNGLLPQGLAWPRQLTTTFQKAVAGFAGIWGNTVESLAELLLTKESDPRATVILLPDWERAWGLPDKCIAEPQTIIGRQLALVNKMTMMGGQSREFFINTGKRIGYNDLQIREWAPWMVGISMCGDTRMGEDVEPFFKEAVTTIPATPMQIGPPASPPPSDIPLSGQEANIIPQTSGPRVWFATGNAQIDTTDAVFGTGSLLLDPTTLDTIYAPAHQDWVLRDYKFTIEGFFKCTRPANTSWVALTCQANAAGLKSFWIGRSPSNIAQASRFQADLYTNNGQFTLFSTLQYTDVVNPGWHYFRFVRAENTITLTIDNVIQSSIVMPANTIVTTVSAPLSIGGWGDFSNSDINNTWGGRVDDFQFSVGVARFDSVPLVSGGLISTPIEADQYTKTLLHFEGDDGARIFTETLTPIVPPPTTVPPPLVDPKMPIILSRDKINYRWEIGAPEMRFYWSVRIGAVRYTWFRVSAGQAGVNHHLEFAMATDLECVLRRWKPAHTEIIFDYSPTFALDFSQSIDVSWMLMMT